MTPSEIATSIVNAWSKTWMDQAAKPTIKMQITKAIEHDRRAMGLEILNLVYEDEKIGPWTKDRVANYVMDVLGIEEGTTV